jgi:hypothetical protein
MTRPLYCVILRTNDRETYLSGHGSDYAAQCEAQGMNYGTLYRAGHVYVSLRSVTFKTGCIVPVRIVPPLE